MPFYTRSTPNGPRFGIGHHGNPNPPPENPAAADSNDVQWAPVHNTHSDRWHAFRDGKACCGIPWQSLGELAGHGFPGEEKACLKCMRMTPSMRMANLNGTKHP